MERWELEGDLSSFNTTGEWVDGVTPKWAEEEAKKTGRDPKDFRVIFAGYQKLVAMLEDELFYARNAADMYQSLNENS